MKSVEKNRIKSVARKIGFHDKGDFLVRARSKDIIAGLAIDGAPSSTYVWTFLLPAFDDLEFMHMSLGARVVNLATLEQPLEESLKDAWDAISPIRDAERLIAYLDAEGIGGEYAEWTRFICLIRLGKFDEAEGMLSSVKNLTAASIPQKLKEMDEFKSYGGWAAVQDLLVEWSSRTDQLVSGVPLEL
ncbi:hypothetical protein [Stakelama tenebrarum]|uniref:DUF4304 domain-containing protein n=1 Tax=Stakelama tenebrarum TaxID=2711215 RepID=A0A6G6Y4Q5_9SPHN|nr:hypothetical protein [Sphingosinithalassobacter tenebrarum]QIG79934.1 hypothetical protein G5C33_09200 [Sphingosinithalassobacter tenebrarum]